MQHIVFPSRVEGRLMAPASKSVAQRAIAIAALARGQSLIEYPGQCDDVLSAIKVCRSLGAIIDWKENSLAIEGGVRAPEHPLNCGESGLGIRMFSGIAATFDTEVILTGSGSLLGRPMHMIESSLTALGVSCSTTDGRLPLRVKGPLRGGHANIDGSQSSQALTGILIASAFADQDVVLHVSDLKSKEYIDITTRVMKSFGVNVSNENYSRFGIVSRQSFLPATFRVEGDWSGAAFLLVAGAIAGRVVVDNLDWTSSQPDRKIIEALRAAGAMLIQHSNQVETVRNELHSFAFDATHCPDLFPPLAALAANCKGESHITGISRLRSKESDRAATLKETFGKLGIAISLDGDTMVIAGGNPSGGSVDSHGDHRIAMAAAIAALNANEKVIINNAQAVNKSYPSFFDDLTTITYKK